MTAGSPWSGVAVVVPCRNEAGTIGQVVADFLAALPGCTVVVADNGSTDGTTEAALAAGARVLQEHRPGKGMAVRRLLADVDADCYLLVDGDATYDATAAPALVERVLVHGMDMVNGTRLTPEHQLEAYRRGHRLGNDVLSWIFRRLFELPLTDTLTGYRAFSRRFVKSFPASSEGFEIEAELNAHAALLDVRVDEVETTYVSRPEGSVSKLNTYRDGVRILRRNLRLFRDARPLLSFSLLASPWLLATALLLVLPVSDYVATGLVAHFPSLIAGVGTFLVALNLWAAGVVLERTSRNRVEVVRLRYLALPAPAGLVARADVPPRAGGVEVAGAVGDPRP
ncbi:MAG: glycosyltransferase [Frankiales bacterium]|nr:glycosyltransferase [Frankiales bacterium]